MPEYPSIDFSDFNDINLIHFKGQENGLFYVQISGHDKIGIFHTIELEDLPVEQKNELVTIALNLLARRN